MSRAERAAAGAVRGWIVGLAAVGIVGWVVLLAVGAVISSGRAAFWLPTAMLAVLVVPNLLLVAHASSTWREGGSEQQRSGWPVILFALAVAAVAYLVGLTTETDPGSAFRLVAAAWGTMVFLGQILFLRGLPASDPPA